MGTDTEQTRFFVPEEHEEELQDMPPSCAAVYNELARSDALSTSDLAERLYSNPRTVRYAVGRLESAGLVGARWGVQDARTQYYYVTDPEEDDDD